MNRLSLISALLLFGAHAASAGGDLTLFLSSVSDNEYTGTGSIALSGNKHIETYDLDLSIQAGDGGSYQFSNQTTIDNGSDEGEVSSSSFSLKVKDDALLYSDQFTNELPVTLIESSQDSLEFAIARIDLYGRQVQEEMHFSLSGSMLSMETLVRIDGQLVSTDTSKAAGF